MAAQENPMSTKRIKVERAFYISRVAQKVGDVIEVGAAFAKELVDAQKASFVVAEAPKPEPEKSPEPKAKSAAPTESKAASPQKGEKHVPG
jgi:hypothetical protein